MNPGHDRPANILVVDDDAINLMVIEQMLGASGFAVVSAVDGVDAVAKAALFRPALVLMDISMPRMSGIDAAIAIRRQSAARCPKIVAVTANVTDQQREACRSAGFDGFLGKPVEMANLLAAVGEFIA
ncbi:MAG: response regulator [Alphaproteobacteria bacterium]